MNRKPKARKAMASQTPGRRRFFRSLFTIGGYVVSGAAGALGRDLLAQTESMAARARMRQIAEEERVHLLNELFFSPGLVFDGHAADDSKSLPVPAGHDTYANEEYAAGAIRDLGQPSRDFRLYKDPFDILPDHSIIAIGSGYSNRLTRLVMGHPSDPHFYYSGAGFAVELPYSIYEIPGERVVRLEDGRHFETSRRAIVAKDRTAWLPRVKASGEIDSDLLLVTLMPWSTAGRDLLVFAGVHGPAVMAVRGLLFDIRLDDLRRLADRVRGHRYFQAAFEIPRVTADGSTHLPEGIRLLEDTVSTRIVRLPG
jgi:hypothetical protein